MQLKNRSQILRLGALGVGLPKNIVLSTDIDKATGNELGYTERLSHIKQRYYVVDESASDLACIAVNDALSQSDVSLNEIGCLISGSGTMEQAVPYNAAKIHAQLDFSKPVPSFDVNMTCLSALRAIELGTVLLKSGGYKNILVVSSEIASAGIRWSDEETGPLFGDGSAALLLSRESGRPFKVLASHFETHSEGVGYAQVRGGGTLLPPSKISGSYKDYGLFEMRGKDSLRLVNKILTTFLDTLFKKSDVQLKDINWIVPHQASFLGLEYLRKKLGVSTDKFINIISTHGNQIAASIPFALHNLLQSRDVKGGDRILLFGTSAGLSIGGMVVEFL